MTIHLLCFKTVTVSKGIGPFHAFCGLLWPVFGTVCRIAGFQGVCLRLSPMSVDKSVVKMAEAASGAGRMGDACFCGSVFSDGVLFTGENGDGLCPEGEAGRYRGSAGATGGGFRGVPGSLPDGGNRVRYRPYCSPVRAMARFRNPVFAETGVPGRETEIKSVSRSFRRIFGRAVCRNGGNGNDQGRFPNFFPFASVFSDRKQDNGASSEPDREETQAWDGNDRPEVKTEKYRDTGRRKTGPSHSVETVSCRTDEAFPFIDRTGRNPDSGMERTEERDRTACMTGQSFRSVTWRRRTVSSGKSGGNGLFAVQCGWMCPSRFGRGVAVPVVAENGKSTAGVYSDGLAGTGWGGWAADFLRGHAGISGQSAGREVFPSVHDRFLQYGAGGACRWVCRQISLASSANRMTVKATPMIFAHMARFNGTVLKKVPAYWMIRTCRMKVRRSPEASGGF